MLRALDGMIQYPPLLVKLERKEPHKLLRQLLPVPLPARHPRGEVPQELGREGRRLRDPPHDHHLVQRPRARRREGEGPGLQADALDLDADVADYGEAVPREGRGPEGGLVGCLAVCDGEVRVGGGEEVERDVWGEDLGGEGLLEDCREAFFEDGYRWGVLAAVTFNGTWFGVIEELGAHSCPGSPCSCRPVSSSPPPIVPHPQP